MLLSKFWLGAGGFFLPQFCKTVASDEWPKARKVNAKRNGCRPHPSTSAKARPDEDDDSPPPRAVIKYKCSEELFVPGRRERPDSPQCITTTVNHYLSHPSSFDVLERGILKVYRYFPVLRTTCCASKVKTPTNCLVPSPASSLLHPKPFLPLVFPLAKLPAR